MPALHNPKQEHFAQLRKRGMSANKAYALAGYKPHRGNCWRLSVNERIKRRVAELTRHIAVKTRVTVETLTEELDDAASVARANDQAGAMVQAISTKAKLHGLLVERKETGAPGDFSALQDAEAIVAKVRAEAGDAAAQLIAEYIARQAKPEPDQGLTTAEAKGNC